MFPRRSSLHSTAARREVAGWAVAWWIAVTAVAAMTHILERAML
jgi:hypothetical protein